MRVEIERLEDHAHAPSHGREFAARGRDRTAFEEDLAGVGFGEPVAAAEQGALPRTRGPDERHEFGIADREVDIPEGRDAGEGLADPPEFENRVELHPQGVRPGVSMNPGSPGGPNPG